MFRVLALLLILAAAAQAEDPALARRAAEAERAAAVLAAERAREAAALQDRLAAERVTGAARVQAAERAALGAAAQAEAARLAEAEARAEQSRLMEELAPLLPLLMRLAAQPVPLLLAAPLPPAEVALSLAAMRAMVQQAQSMAARLRQVEERAAEEAARAVEERARFSVAEREARHASAALDRQLDAARSLLAERSAAERAAAARAEDAVQRARSLEEALARLERQQARRTRPAAREEPTPRAEAAATPEPPPAPSRSVAEAGLPVAGQVIRGFNQPGEGGLTRGLTFAAQPGARVTAPCTGSVAFAAPFRSYGRMVILDCGQRQHLVLAGMERIDVTAGQRVRAGEPVGVLSGAARPTLYVELRRGGEAVDPRPWFRSGA